MTAMPVYPIFKARDDYTIFMERLHNAFIVNKTPAVDRVAILLNQIDGQVYKTLRSLCDPVVPASKTFDEISGLLRQQYVCETSAWKARRQFFNSRQKPTETVNEWFLRLKTLAINCNFGKDLSKMLETKFVCGLEQPMIFERISEESCSVTIDTILQIAIKKEAVLPKPLRQQDKPKSDELKPVASRSQKPPLNENIHATAELVINKRVVQPKTMEKKHQPWSVGPKHVQPKSNPSQFVKMENSGKNETKMVEKCWHCGLPDHDFKKCRPIVASKPQKPPRNENIHATPELVVNKGVFLHKPTEKQHQSWSVGSQLVQPKSNTLHFVKTEKSGEYETKVVKKEERKNFSHCGLPDHDFKKCQPNKNECCVQ